MRIDRIRLQNFRSFEYDALERLIERRHEELFEMDLWPARRGWETFREWFEWEYHSTVFDLV